MNDTLHVFYDNCPPDAPTLCVAKEADKGFVVLNKIQGDEAFGIYHYLTVGAELKSAREIPMQHHHSKVLEIHDKARISVCPNCLGMIVTSAEEFPKFCTCCGQAIDWKEE